MLETRVSLYQSFIYVLIYKFVEEILKLSGDAKLVFLLPSFIKGQQSNIFVVLAPYLAERQACSHCECCCIMNFHRDTLILTGLNLKSVLFSKWIDAKIKFHAKLFSL